MKTIELDYDEALRLLTEVVGEKPDCYSYPGAYGVGDRYAYFNGDGTPSCIVGHVLAKKGVTLADLDGRGVNCHSTAAQLLNDPDFHLNADPRATALLQKAQSVQDNDDPWSGALARAVSYVAEARASELVVQ